MSFLQRFLVVAYVAGAASTELPSLQALAADDECGESGEVCALNALQLRSVPTENDVPDDVENPVSTKNDLEYLNSAFKTIEEVLRDDGKPGTKMDKFAIEKNIREAQANLTHVNGCPSRLAEADGYLNDALSELNNQQDEAEHRREVYKHLKKARKDVKHCKHDLHKKKGLLPTEEDELENEEKPVRESNEEELLPSDEAIAVASASNLTVEAASYARRSTASLTCSQWAGGSARTCSGTVYGPCPGDAGGYYTCSGDWSGADAHVSSSMSCNACGETESQRYIAWAFAAIDSNCHGSFSKGGGHSQRDCIGRCRNGGEYSCSLSQTGSTSVHIACASTCTIGTLPRS